MEAAAGAHNYGLITNIAHDEGLFLLKAQETRSSHSNGISVDHDREGQAAQDREEISFNKRRASRKKDHEDGSWSSIPSSSSQKDSQGLKPDDDHELESAKAEMSEVMEENKRLKSHLAQITKDYRALQEKYLYESAQQKSTNSNIASNRNNNMTPQQAEADDHREESDLVFLSLGRSSSYNVNNNNARNKSNFFSDQKGKEEGAVVTVTSEADDQQGTGSQLSLGLGTKTETTNKGTSLDHETAVLGAPSTENSFDEVAAGDQTWRPPCKNERSSTGEDDHDVVHQPPVKKARVSVRARCDTPTMNDGCQWRKYGQKIAKGNPCPRAYYRCTVAPSCPVRKQVQRCAEDMSILITTYEGTHNHPLPVSATAMASTTSAAAYMLMSGSSNYSGCSQGSAISTLPASTSTATTLATGLQGMNNYNILPPDSTSKPFIFLPSSSFSPSPSHPTITLDLTSSTASSSTSDQFNRNFAPRYNSSTNLTFNSSDQQIRTSAPITWPNGTLVGHNYQSYNNNNQAIGSSMNSWKTPQDSISYPTSLQRGTSTIVSNTNQPPLPDAIAAAAKALTSDPSFHSVLTAALSSFISGSSIGGGGGGGGGGAMIGNFGTSVPGSGDIGNSGTNFSHKYLKWGTEASSGNNSTSHAASATLSKGNNGCGPSILSIAPSTTKSGSLVLHSSPFPFSTSKSSSASPGDNRDQNT